MTTATGKGEMLRARAQKNKTRREAVLIEFAGVRRQKEMPALMVTARQLDAFTCALRTRVLDREGGFSICYLREFVSEMGIPVYRDQRFRSSEIRFDGTQVPSRCSKWSPVGLLVVINPSALKGD